MYNILILSKVLFLRKYILLNTGLQTITECLQKGLKTDCAYFSCHMYMPYLNYFFKKILNVEGSDFDLRYEI